MCFIGFGSALMTNTKGCSRNDAAMRARCAFWFRFCLPLHQTSLVAPEPTGRRKHLTSNPPTDGFAVANIAASAAFNSTFNLLPLSAILARFHADDL
jgi:hypothetical protein